MLEYLVEDFKLLKVSYLNFYHLPVGNYVF